MNVHRYEKSKKKKKGWQGSNYKLVSPRVSRFLSFQSWTRFIFIKAGFWPRLSTATICASLFIISLTLLSHTTSSAGYFAGENFLIILWSGERVVERLPGQLFADGKFRPPSFFGTNNSDLVTSLKREREECRNLGWMKVDNLFVLSFE